MTPFWLVKRSLLFDYRYCKYSNDSAFNKLILILKKYWLLTKHKVFSCRFKLNESCIKISSTCLYYGSSFGLVDYQTIYARHYHWLKIANVKKLEAVVDVGANVGFFSKVISDMYNPKKIVCFEPVPITFECLEKNLYSLKNKVLLNKAISNKKSFLRMRFDANASHMSRVDTSGNIEVEANTLDYYLNSENLKTIDLLKIDTENFESFVLEGAKKTLKKTKYLMIELSLQPDSKYSFSKITSLLYSNDFDFNLLVYRHFTDKSEGIVTAVECLFYNKLLFKESATKIK